MREFNGKKYYDKKENEEFSIDIRRYNDIIKKDIKKVLTGECDYDIITRALLDSSLIFPTPDEIYTHKIVQCGDYFQVYNYFKKSIKKGSSVEMIKSKKKFKEKSRGEKSINQECSFYKNDGFLDWSKTKTNKDPPEWLHINELVKIESFKREEEKIILKKNIQRAKVELQRLTKANEMKFKSFITLTIAQNITDIKEANRMFDIWRTKVQFVLKKQKKELIYVCVPEFQKRGAVHYHLLTNLDVKSSNIIIPQTEFTEHQMNTMSEAQRNKCYDVKYWKYGFSAVQDINEIDNVVAYISKYMTKDIDNRLWGKRRYLVSHNLKRPSTLFIDCNSDEGFEYLLDINVNYDLKFENYYMTPLKELTNFKEFKKKEVI